MPEQTTIEYTDYRDTEMSYTSGEPPHKWLYHFAYNGGREKATDHSDELDHLPDDRKLSLDLAWQNSRNNN